MTARPRRIIAASILAMLLAATMARADGDPASDTLLGERVFYPYSPPVSRDLQNRLNAETASASRAHFPIKVALIASPLDLGAIPNLFDQPQKYANFLEQEISFQGKPLLLVVMPDGYGVQGLTRASTIAAGSLTQPSGHEANDLARAAILAVPKLAAAAGHPIKALADEPRASAGDNRTPLIIVILALAAITTASTLIAIRQRRAAAPANRGSPKPPRSPAPSRRRRRPRGR